jgi:hypothetical protein
VHFIRFVLLEFTIYIALNYDSFVPLGTYTASLWTSKVSNETENK